MTRSKQTMVGGMSILGLTGILCKVLGLLFSIPLAILIGTEGMGVFQAVFPTYNLLLTISSAGLPVAVSRMVSQYLAKDSPRDAKRSFRIALYILAALGCLCTILVLCFSGILADQVDQPESRIGFLVIAPCVAAVCVLSAFRGFMQGQQDMKPTAISQLWEQVGKLVFSLPLAYLGAKKSIALGASGALMGITLSEFMALCYMVLCYRKRRASFAVIPQSENAAAPRDRDMAKQLVRIAVPITIGACIVPFSQFIDSTMLLERMQAAGFDYSTSRSLYGLFSGMVIRLINIPTALALAIAMSIVPAISRAGALKDPLIIRRQSSQGLRFSFVVGFPCSIGMCLLSREIMTLFYARTLTAQQLQIGSELLMLSSLTIVLFTAVQATSSILQGLDRQKIPMYTLAAGVVVKIVLNYTLVAIPSVNIHGASYASLICYAISLIPNLLAVLKVTGMKMDWMGWMVKPMAATACMAVPVLLLQQVLPIALWSTVLKVAAGVAAFAGSAILLKAITPEDLAAFTRRAGKRKEKK